MYPVIPDEVVPLFEVTFIVTSLASMYVRFVYQPTTPFVPTAVMWTPFPIITGVKVLAVLVRVVLGSSRPRT